jgi:rare lipoprotein A
MQTKLRAIGLVASLLLIAPMFAGQAKAKYIGIASWYGKKHQGRKMANGQKFDRSKLTAASWYFPLGTLIRVVNVKSQESVVVTITDRGPNIRLHRVLDLSEAAAERLGYIEQGTTHVFLYPIRTFETGAAIFEEAK